MELLQVTQSHVQIASFVALFVFLLAVIGMARIIEFLTGKNK